MRIQGPVAGERVRLEGEGPSLAIIRQRDDRRVGRIEFEESGGALLIQSVCIDEGQRGYGCGQDAAFLLLRKAKASGYRIVRAWAPPDLGLAVYFWFRIGFHPLHGEGPQGGIWFERRL